MVGYINLNLKFIEFDFIRGMSLELKICVSEFINCFFWNFYWDIGKYAV